MSDPIGVIAVRIGEIAIEIGGIRVLDFQRRRTFGRDNESARLRLAFLVVAIIYNFTEAAFKSFHLVFIAFLLAAVARPVVWDREES